jgi:coproporphyrinogen III oxidase
MTVSSEQELSIIAFLRALRETIISAFEQFEPSKRFEKTPWNYQKGTGGGEIGLLRGDVFEKAGVNFSAIHGDQFPMQDGSGPFFATGVSLITHLHNPHAPTVHMNIRYIRTAEKTWLGGGYDLTPMGYPYDEDTKHFHAVAKHTLDQIDPAIYPQFSQNARDYFYIPHRKKERGVGGIFFDHYATGHFEQDLKLWKGVGLTFLDAILPIYQRRVQTPFGSEERQKQLEMRAHYVEYNLMYDRGTKFGFQSGGNPDAILCSMPPLVRW